MIAATNQDLEAAVAARSFREDLYFRLRVIPIQLPPLRERREDIPELTDYFVAQGGAGHGRAAPRTLSPEALEMLRVYRWPGNVRELENCRAARGAARARQHHPRRRYRAVAQERHALRAAAEADGAALGDLITPRIAR